MSRLATLGAAAGTSADNKGLDGVKAALGPLNRTPDAAASIVTTGPKTSQRPSHSGATSYGLDQPLPASHTSKQATQPAHERQDSSALPAPPLPTLQRGGTGSSLAQPSYGLLSEITPAAAPSPAAGFGFGPGGNPDLDPGLRGLSSSGQQTAAPFPVAPSQPPTLVRGDSTRQDQGRQQLAGITPLAYLGQQQQQQQLSPALVQNQTGPYGLQAEQPTGAGRAPSFSGVAGMAPGAAASSQQLPGPGPATTQLFGPKHPGAQLDGALMHPQPAAQLLQGQYQHQQAGLQDQQAGLQDQQQLGQQYQQQPGQPGQQYQQQLRQQYQQQLGQQYQQQAGTGYQAVSPPAPAPAVSPAAPPPLFTLDQLPANQRVVGLTAIQANDVLQQMAAQAQQAGARGPVLVDLVDAQRTFLDHLTPPPHAYVHTLEMATPDKHFPPNVKPSLLQTKLKTGHNSLQGLLKPLLEPGQQGFIDLGYSPQGALQEELGRVWQCCLTLLRAEGVGPTGLIQERTPWLHVARIGLFDRSRNRFLGNVLGVRPEGVTKKGKTWTFNPKTKVLLRCSCVQPDPGTGTRLVNDEALSLYIELNTSHRLDVADTKNMPPSELKAFKLVDEVTTAWAMLSFKRCCQSQVQQEVSVPLYYGSLFEPKLLDNLYKAKRSAQPLASLFKVKPNPVLVFKAGGLHGEPASLLPYSFMPSTMLATEELAMALACFRATLALQLVKQESAFAPVADPVLSAFPGILADHHLLIEFLVKWQDATLKLEAGLNTSCLGPSLAPPIASLVEAFRRCVAEVSPLLRCASLPLRHINNFVEYQGHRLKQVQAFCHVIDAKTNTVVGARHPVEPMSHAGFEFLHAPFNVTEVRMCMGDPLEKKYTFLTS